MNEIELEVLRLLESGPAALRGLLSRLPRSSVYRSARTLRVRGLIARAGRGRWCATPAGVVALRETSGGTRATSASSPAQPSLPIPALDLLPTDVHRAVARLAVLAARARRRQPRHHLSLVLVGPPLRGKTWLMHVVARLVGADPAVSILHGGMQTAGGLGARRNSKGEVAAVRDALRSPLLAIDEWQRSSPGVKRATAALLHGERHLALENDEALEVTAVVMLGLNPAAAGTLEERLGLDAALIRRAVVVDFAGVDLPTSFAERGEELLDEITALGPVTLPEPASQAGEDRALRESARAALAETLDGPERVATLDVHAVAQLATEATGVLAPRDALRLVLADLLTLWSTLGWVRADWRARLDAALPAGADPRGLSLPAWPMAQPAPVAPMNDVNEAHAWEARMARFDAFLAKRGLFESEDLAPALDLASALEEHRVALSAAAVPWLARALRVISGPGEESASAARLAALEALDLAGADPGGTAHLAVTARGLGWRTRDAAEVLRVVSVAEDALGVTADGLEYLADEIRRLDVEPTVAGAVIVDMVRRYGTARRAVDQVEARLKVLHEAVARAEERENAARARVSALEVVLGRAVEDPQVAPWLSVSDAKLARQVYEGRLKLGSR